MDLVGCGGLILASFNVAYKQKNSIHVPMTPSLGKHRAQGTIDSSNMGQDEDWDRYRPTRASRVPQRTSWTQLQGQGRRDEGTAGILQLTPEAYSTVSKHVHTHYLCECQAVA